MNLLHSYFNVLGINLLVIKTIYIVFTIDYIVIMLFYFLLIPPNLVLMCL